MKRFFCVILCLILGMGGTFVLVGCKKEESRCLYSIEGEYFPAERKFTAVMHFSYVNNTDTQIDTLAFHLYGNAYREDAKYEPVSSLYREAAYYDGESYGSMEITSVQGSAKWEVGGEDKNILYLRLDQPLFPEEKGDFSIGYTLTLAKINHRTGVTEKVVNLCNFYPVLCVWEEGKGYYECVYYADGDPFYSDFADYKVKLTLPAGYAVVGSAPGTEKMENGKKVWSGTLQKAQDFALAFGEGLKTAQRNCDGVTVNYLYDFDENVEKTFDTACRSLRYFSEAFGKYAYGSFAMVRTGFIQGGMEYPGMVLLSDQLEGENYLYTLVHETAHQWWYAGVGSNQCEYAWMDEGLAEYATLLFYENNPDYGKTREDMINSVLTKYKAYAGIYGKLFGENEGTMSRNLGDFISEYEYVSVTYNKGALLFDSLRTGIGDRRFFSGLKNYYRRYLFRHAEPDDMIDCFRSTGVDVDGLFKSFIG